MEDKLLMAAGTTRKYTLVQVEVKNNTWKQQTNPCYNLQEEGSYAKQCTKPKRKRDENMDSNDKRCLLFKLKQDGQAIIREEIAFLADLGLPDIQTSQTVITHNAPYQADDLDAYDSDCDKLNSAKIALMANLSRNGSDALTETETEITSDSNIIPYSHANKDLTTELDRYKEEVKDLKEMQNVDNSFSGSNEQYAEIVRLKQTIFKQVQEKDSLMKTVSDLKIDLKIEENRNIDREIALEKKIKQLDNIIFKREYDGNVIFKMDTIVIPDSVETLMLCEESRSKMLLKEQDPMV
ncbi:hypothetical protein Tco_0921851, partial [Tanacetum coccineum]